jgi:hypothetical protein
MRLFAFFVIATYVLLGNQITADKAVFCVAVSITMVETIISFFSSAVSGLGELSVSMDRIEVNFNYIFQVQTIPAES